MVCNFKHYLAERIPPKIMISITLEGSFPGLVVFVLSVIVVIVGVFYKLAGDIRPFPNRSLHFFIKCITASISSIAILIKTSSSSSSSSSSSLLSSPSPPSSILTVIVEKTKHDF